MQPQLSQNNYGTSRNFTQVYGDNNIKRASSEFGSSSMELPCSEVRSGKQRTLTTSNWRTQLSSEKQPQTTSQQETSNNTTIQRVLAHCTEVYTTVLFADAWVTKLNDNQTVTWYASVARLIPVLHIGDTKWKLIFIPRSIYSIWWFE